jgi:hypothetical protein
VTDDEQITAPVRTVVSNGAVDSLLPLGDRLYFGGSFTTVGPRTGPTARVPIGTDRADLDVAQVSGAARMSIGAESWLQATDAWVTIADGAGGYYVGGDFSYVGGRPHAGLAHVLMNGKVDPQFQASVIGWNNGFGMVNSLVLAGDRLFI